MLCLYNQDIKNKIRTLYLEGKKIIEIQEILGINKNTWDAWYWEDRQGFRQFMIDTQNERMKLIARKNIEDIAGMPVEHDDDVRFLKIKADMSTFIAETLDREHFKKKDDEDSEARTPINIAINNYKRIKEYKKTLPKPKEG